MKTSDWTRLALVAAGLCVIAAGVRAQTGQHGIAGFTSAKPEAVGMSSARLALLGDAVRKEIADSRVPGAVVAIARRGQLVYYEAFGYLDKVAGTTMPKDAIFSIASMTKPIFTVAALSLYEEGRLLMNEPVAAYLPELRQRRVATNADGSQTEPARRQPTVQDLMRHTSGFITRDAEESALHKRYPVPLAEQGELEYLAALATLPLRHQPGATWEYGPGFDILGVAIGRVAGQPVHEFLTQRIFGPLGMPDTHFTIPASKGARQAKPLPKDPLTGEAQVVRDQTKPRAADGGGGGLASTAGDYLRFAQMLLNGGELNGKRVLGPRTVAYMTSDQAGPEIDLTRLHTARTSQAYGHGFGLGVAVRRSTGLGTTTGSPGDFKWAGSQGTAFWVDPKEQLAIVWMTQTPGDIRPYHRQLIPALVYQAIVE